MASVDEDECIILSSNDKAEDLLDYFVFLVKHSEDLPLEEGTVEVVDEDVMVTFCKKPKLMAHARHDCTSNFFERAECETSRPLGRNAETCDECYCYICNKQATECKYWVTPSQCHCNAHNKSAYWKRQWNVALTGGLGGFNLNPSKIDADVQRAGALLQEFNREVSVKYGKYLAGEIISLNCSHCSCQQNLDPGLCYTCDCLQQPITYRYSPVSDLVAHFLDQAEQEKPKVEVVMLLGAAKEILYQESPALHSQIVDVSAIFINSVTNLMKR
uniref:Uncharacterized protein n=2 Tax=Anolis carolinensis TaxID=28377 RepID=R4G9R1_ANOCA